MVYIENCFLRFEMRRHSPLAVSSGGEEDPYEVSALELRRMARALSLYERERGCPKYTCEVNMTLSGFCRMTQEMQTRRRSSSVAVGRDALGKSFELFEMTQKGRRRRRERSRRRNRRSRELRRSLQGLRDSGELYDDKTFTRLHSQRRRDERQLYKEGLAESRSREGMDVCSADDSGSLSSDELEFVELSREP